jgi:cellulose synthase (UDP-forming)
LSTAVTDSRGSRYRGSHRRRPAAPPMVLPAPPDDQEKYLYASRHLPYLAVLLAICSGAAIASQVRFEAMPWMWPFGIFTALTALAFGLALPFSFAGRGFDWAAHQMRVQAWRPARYPDVDIYLPICAEPADVLRNTWAAVFELGHGYPGTLRAYVLDDGADPEAERLAANFGFGYVVRPDRGVYKKSGNLRHAFTRTRGEFFVILDADFAPRADFLAETLPYFDDPDTGIVQTPQYFRTSADQAWIERAAGAMQEIFYRAIQVSRDRMGAAICVGSCAVYRRAAVAPAGGPTLIAYAEDVHTGLDVIRHGWQVRYVPVVLATGMCPPSLDMFVHQQYRWCRGATSTVLTSRLWRTPMTLSARLSHLSGLAYYAQTALAVFAVPLIALALLARDPAAVGLANSQLILLAVAAGMFLLPAWATSAYNIREVFPLMEVRGWAHALALWDWLRGTTMPWEPTGGPVSRIRRFRVGVVAWNGSAAVAWLILAGWRIASLRSGQYLILAAMALLYTAGQGRVLWALLRSSPS